VWLALIVAVNCSELQWGHHGPSISHDADRGNRRGGGPAASLGADPDRTEP
jgi:hypothetical protein